MILLVTEYDSIAWDLHYTLLRTRGDVPVISLESSPNLPEDVTSIWSALYVDCLNDKQTPLHINNLPLPLDYEVERVDGRFLIKTIDRVIGEVIISEPTIERIISEIHWFDEKGTVFKKDYYNEYGFMYKSSSFIGGFGLAGSQFYSRDGKLLATWNHQTDSVVVGTKIFPTLSEFYLYCLEILGYQDKGIIFNNLGEPLQVIISKSNQGGNVPENLLVFSERVMKLPKNVDYILSHPELNTTVTVGGFDGAKDLCNKAISSFEFISPMYKDVQSKNSSDVVITTETDNIWELDKIVSSCPTINFHVAAPTKMSDKLMDFEKYSNVKLYPQASQSQVESLLEKAPIFLDIANSRTVYNANVMALRYSCYRLGVWGISSGKHISDMCMYNSNDSEFLIQHLNYITLDLAKLQQLLEEENTAIGYSYDV